MRRSASLSLLLLLLAAPWGVAAEQTPRFPAWEPSPKEVSDAAAALAEAAQSLADGRLEAAADRVRAAGRLLPTSACPHVLLGLILEQQERPAEAVEEYRAALSWDPQESRALAALERLQAPRFGDLVGVYEAQLVDLINEARRAEGVGALKPHPVLAEVARAHSADMRDLGFFAHDSPKRGEKTSVERLLRRFDCQPLLLGENISRRWVRPGCALTADNIALSHQGLMGSPGHRRNILHPDFVYVGVGIATNAQGDYWITELFMRPRPARPPSGTPRRRPSG